MSVVSPKYVTLTETLLFKTAAVTVASILYRVLFSNAGLISENIQ